MGAPRVTAAKRLEFRAAMLELGVIRQAAKQTKIPLGTCFGLAKELEKDPTFVQERAELRARVLPELEAKLIGLADVIVDRVLVKDLTPKELAAIAVEHELKSFSYQNPKPQYVKGLVDLFKSIAATRKGDDLAAGQGGPAVVINVTGAVEPEADAPPG